MNGAILSGCPKWVKALFVNRPWAITAPAREKSFFRARVVAIAIAAALLVGNAAYIRPGKHYDEIVRNI